MFTQLVLSNFKAWPVARLKMGKITGLFGTNSSGKTSLIQFILLLKQTKEAADRGLALAMNGSYVTLGSYRDFVHKHDETRNISWGLSWLQDEELAIFDPSTKRTEVFAKGKHLAITSMIRSVRGAPRAEQLEYRLGTNHKFRLQLKANESTAFELKSEGSFAFKRTPGRAWQLPGPVKSYGFPDQALTYFQNSGFLSLFVSAFESQMDRTFYLGPLREPPKRDYVWSRSRPSDVGSRGEFTIEAIIAATEAGELRNLSPKAKLRPFQEMIAYWLKEMGLVDSFTVEEIKAGSGLYQVKVVVRKGAPEVLLTEVGFGVSQILPVLTLLYYVEEGSTVLLEQPEIHLHPLAQSGLADVMLSVSERRNVQIIVESHSEHFLLRLQRRIAEKKAKASDIKLYFCEVSGAETTLSDLEVDERGVVKNWPQHFFGDAFGETAAAQKARLTNSKT
jgi:predicted ATPase